jgi:CDP-diacylglycerol--glycerol-3-phosphate 3-phosphatidyltransferase
MKLVSRFTEKHPDLFTFLPAEEVHPHDHFLARTVLRWIPKSITPNEITTLRILATPYVLYLIIEGYYTLGAIMFLLVAFTDALDGSMARTRNQVTRFGMMYDPLADKLLIGTMVLLLVFQYFNYWLGVAILGIEIVFILLALVARLKFHTVKSANRWGKIKMISQVCAMFLTLSALVLNIPYLLTAAAWIFGIAIGFAIISLFTQGI